MQFTVICDAQCRLAGLRAGDRRRHRRDQATVDLATGDRPSTIDSAGALAIRRFAP